MIFDLIPIFGTFGLTAAGLAAATGVAGLGLSLVGQNAQKKANAKAMDQNAQLQQRSNDSQWASYLMSRGIAPTSPVAAGVIPSRDQYRPINTRLPLWASAPATMTPRRTLPSGTVPRLVKL